MRSRKFLPAKLVHRDPLKVACDAKLKAALTLVVNPIAPVLLS